MKSILDVPATLERLESLSVTVVGYRTTTFPGFYVADSGSTLDWSVADPGAGRGRLRRPPRARAGRGRRRQPAAGGRAARPRPARPRDRRCAGRRGAGRRPRQGRSRRSSSTTCTGPARARPWRSTCGWCCATPSWPGRSPRRCRAAAGAPPSSSSATSPPTSSSSSPGEPAPGSDRPASHPQPRGRRRRQRRRPPGPARRRRSLLAGCIGDDAAGRRAGRRADRRRGRAGAAHGARRRRPARSSAWWSRAGSAACSPTAGRTWTCGPTTCPSPPPGGHLHLSGYTLLDPRPPGRRPGARSAAASRPAARSRSTRPRPARSRAYGVDRWLADTAGATLLLPNADEARLLTGCGDPADAARALAEPAPRRGGQPRGRRRAVGVGRRCSCTGPRTPTDVVDTTGAGRRVRRRPAGGLARPTRPATRPRPWTPGWPGRPQVVAAARGSLRSAVDDARGARLSSTRSGRAS